MAAELVGGALLGAFLNVVLDKMASPEVINLVRGKKLDPKLLQRLETTLKVVRAVLDDAEKKQIRDSNVNSWLNDLEDALYEADDLLDEVATKAMSRKEVSNTFSRLFKLHRRKIVTKLEDVVERLESILKLKNSLDLKEITMGNLPYSTPSTSLLDSAAHIYGRDTDKEAIIKLLLDDTEEVSMIPIVGMGGVGKTTLAQFVYNNDNLNKIFDFKAWGTKGSKVLVTTRSNKVASIVQTVPTYYLDQLSSEDCWLVFANHAGLSSISSEKKTTLEKVGREIVKKCRGLPLAAQSLGSILRRKDDIREWNNMLNSDIWELPENESKIIPALRISYHYLPSHLKRCFVYCSLFSKYHRFGRDDLIWLWMAEGLLSWAEKRKDLEVGRECFDYLVSRSFFQSSTTKGWKQEECFVMHDLIHDLATFLAGAFYFGSEELGKETMTRINRKTRHLSFNECNFPFLENSEVFESIKFLRTFLPPKYLYYHFNNQEKEVRMLLSKLKCARVLSFQCFGNLSVLPDTIGELIHLRYLDLSGTDIMALPESLCDLYNLQTLKLYDCGKLTILPSGMQKLVNLLHLDIRTTPLEEMPKGMSKLNQLQYLSDYIVGKHEENGIKELGGLSNLHGWLSIIRLENVRNDDEAKEARIMDKKHVEKLELHWSSDTGDNSQTEMNILCKLQPHWDLQSLLINGYRGTTFPDWVGNSSYNTMTALTLSSCKNCVTLPSLGQLPSLKNMWISDLDRLKTIDGGFYGNINDSSLSTPFPILESLVFEDMPCWEMWSSFEPLAFPQLKKLQIRNCLRLSGELPNHLPALKDLHIESCNQLDSSLPMAPLICDLRIIRSDKVAFMKEQKHELLESLELNNSRNSLSSLPLETFPNLKRLYLIKYDSQSEEGLGAPSSDKLKSLICQMNTLFPNLEHLTIEHCPGIESFPEGGMPPSLRKIVIGNCEKLLSGSAWPSMDLLTRACISGPCDGMKSFPMEGLLPPSLTSLTLNEFSSLETLDCKGLLHLTSLRQLQIEYCRKLENITGERLPASLIELDILRCPLLEERCRMKDPQIWPKISHIQSILINWKPIS